MLYPFMTLNDNTEIVHSESYQEDGKEVVRVEIEKPVEGGFHSAQCILPMYRWENINGFSEDEIRKFTELIQSMAHIIIDLSRTGGFENAAGF